MSNTAEQPPKKFLKAAIGVIGILILFIATDFFSKYMIEQKKNEPFMPQEGVHFVKIDKSQEVSELLLSLGVGEYDSFEVMSYSCHACRSIEPALEYAERINNINIYQFQIGSTTLPWAEAEYYVSQISPSNMPLFRNRMFTKMLSTSTLEEKVSFARNIPFEFGLTEQQLNGMDVEAKQYAQNTLKLADMLEIKQTPTVFIKGQYKIVHEAHASFDQYNQTLKFILDNK